MDDADRVRRQLRRQERARALSLVRTWVATEVDDWYDPVIDPDLNDALRMVVGLTPIDRTHDDDD